MKRLDLSFDETRFLYELLQAEIEFIRPKISTETRVLLLVARVHHTELTVSSWKVWKVLEKPASEILLKLENFLKETENAINVNLH
ncbi:MAG: hypothetical protein IPJ69_02015 [Deltaproteobacteria bacterium]|nr:MAG: hypothetical protein IPJ69_02015 [Deltaproteobacteria bacterium]